MEFAVEMSSVAMIYIKTGSAIQKLRRGNTDTDSTVIL
jgi:hypothetical protein